MRIAIGCDHAGFEWKEKVKAILTKMGHEVIDFGTNSKESVDYPDFGLKVAHAVADGEVDYGMTVCWTGNGMNMAANKVKGIRAGLAVNPEMAHLTRLHNNANVLALGSVVTPLGEVPAILEACGRRGGPWGCPSSAVRRPELRAPYEMCLRSTLVAGWFCLNSNASRASVSGNTRDTRPRWAISPFTIIRAAVRKSSSV